MIPLPSQKMIKSGVTPTKDDHRDYDFLKHKKLGAVLPSFASDYNIDAGLWTPDQEVENDEFNPPVPAMPFGCTDYAQCELCIDEDGEIYNPAYLESFTHANANGGGDLRVSLQAVIDHGLQAKDGMIHRGAHPAYFSVKSSGAIDWFDAVRLAMLSTSNEKRGVSVGTPWYPEFMSTPDGIYPIPDFSLNRASWHNHCIKGWKTINGVTYLIDKPWCGASFGDKGFGYISRPLFNSLMNIPGTAAFMIDKLLPGETPPTVDLPVIRWIVSYVRSLFNR